MPAPAAQIVTDSGQCLSLHTDGSLWGWGTNAYGSLGDGTTDISYSPKAIGRGQLAKQQRGRNRLYPGPALGRHALGLGRNDYGQLGDGPAPDRSSPG